MHIVDVIIIVLYIILTLGVGVWVSKKASEGLDSYFLGGKTIKWYYLGLSNDFGYDTRCITQECYFCW